MNQSLYTKVVEVSNLIHSKSLRASNWLVTSPNVASIFDYTSTSNIFDYSAGESTIDVTWAGKYRSIDDPWEASE